jgi:hypothetical protein
MDEGDGSFAAFVVPFPLDAASVRPSPTAGSAWGGSSCSRTRRTSVTERRSAGVVLVAATLTPAACATSSDRSPPEALPDPRLSYPLVPTDPGEPQETFPAAG